MQDEIKICSLNSRGLGDTRKLKDLFHYLSEKRYSLYLIQDTHLTAEQTKKDRAIWGYEVLLSPGRSNSRGTLILFNNNFEYKLLHSENDEKGNLIAAQIKVNEKYTFSRINIYGPNNDNPLFYDKLRNLINDFNSDSVVISGDFNLVLDPEKDYYGSAHRYLE